jgi:hypothetical protein|nr:MAG TPA: hypothetical protein [Caudoviricetes sp.]
MGLIKGTSNIPEGVSEVSGVFQKTFVIVGG